MKSTTPTYRVEFSNVVDVGGGRRIGLSSQGYDCKRSGRPSDENLAAFVRGLEDSTLPGGVNAHLGVTRVGAATIVRQATGRVVATYTAAMFEVVR